MLALRQLGDPIITEADHHNLNDDSAVVVLTSPSVCLSTCCLLVCLSACLSTAGHVSQVFEQWQNGYAGVKITILAPPGASWRFLALPGIPCLWWRGREGGRGGEIFLYIARPRGPRRPVLVRIYKALSGLQGLSKVLVKP